MCTDQRTKTDTLELHLNLTYVDVVHCSAQDRQDHFESGAGDETLSVTKRPYDETESIAPPDHKRIEESHTSAMRQYCARAAQCKPRGAMTNKVEPQRGNLAAHCCELVGARRHLVILVVHFGTGCDESAQCGARHCQIGHQFAGTVFERWVGASRKQQ